MSTGTTALLGRHLLTDRAAGAAVAAIVLAASFLGAAVPRALDRLATEGLRGTIDQAAPLDRDLLATASGQPPVAYGGTGDPTLPFRQVLDDVEGSLEPLLAEASTGITGSFRYRAVRALEIAPVLPDETDTSLFNLTVLTDPTDVAEPGFASRVRYVAGSPPTLVGDHPRPRVDGRRRPTPAAPRTAARWSRWRCRPRARGCTAWSRAR